MSTLSARHHWTIRKDDGVVCTCLPANARHLFSYQCIAEEDVRAWRKAHPGEQCGPTRARIYAWLEKEYAPQTLALAVKG